MVEVIMLKQDVWILILILTVGMPHTACRDSEPSFSDEEMFAQYLLRSEDTHNMEERRFLEKWSHLWPAVNPSDTQVRTTAIDSSEDVHLAEQAIKTLIVGEITDLAELDANGGWCPTPEDYVARLGKIYIQVEAFSPHLEWKLVLGQAEILDPEQMHQHLSTRWLDRGIPEFSYAPRRLRLYKSTALATVWLDIFGGSYSSDITLTDEYWIPADHFQFAHYEGGWHLISSGRIVQMP